MTWIRMHFTGHSFLTWLYKFFRYTIIILLLMIWLTESMENYTCRIFTFNLLMIIGDWLFSKRVNLGVQVGKGIQFTPSNKEMFQQKIIQVFDQAHNAWRRGDSRKWNDAKIVVEHLHGPQINTNIAKNKLFVLTAPLSNQIHYSSWCLKCIKT